MATFEDYCVITQEDLEGIKDSISTQDLPSAINTIKEYLKRQDLVELNIGVTGESGSGKSTFVNAFRGLGDEEEGSAKTGVVETTTEPEVYLHPKYKNVKVWDLPGIGSPNFKADEYLKGRGRGKGSGVWPSMVTHTRNLSSAFNPSKCTLTAVNTHPEQWAAILRRPGSRWGIGALLKGLTSVVVLKVERALVIHSPHRQSLPDLGIEPATFGLQVQLSNH